MKSKLLQISLPVFLIIIMFSCKSKDVSKTNKEPIITFNNKEIKEEIYNQEKSLLLVLNYTQDINPQKSINYKVLSTKTKEVIKQGTFVGLKLEWFTNNQLKGHLYQGMIEKESDNPLNQTTSTEKNFTLIDIK